jgi:Zn-dependent protease
MECEKNCSLEGHMFGNSWRIARIAGVEIRIDASWAIVVLLIGFLFFGNFDVMFAGTATGVLILLTVVSTILFFASVLLHELAHSLTARGRGLEVRSITLFLFGGVSNIDLDAEHPGDEFWITIVGPFTSLAIALLFWLAVKTAPLPAVWLGALGYLGWVNLALGVFNLVPAFPLDGGRVLRSIAWRVSGDRARATRIASMAGLGFGYLLMGLGLVAIFAGNLVAGLWNAGIGWFLTEAARASYSQVYVQQLLEHVPARRVMRSNLDVLPSDMSLSEAIDEHLLPADHQSFLVSRNGATVGILAKSAIRDTKPALRAEVTVGAVMTLLEDAASVSPETSMDEVLDTLTGHETNRVLVIDAAEVVGIITPRDISHWLRNAKELGLIEHNVLNLPNSRIGSGG